MSIHIILITHDNVGESLLNTAKLTFGELPLPSTAISITHDADPEKVIQQIQSQLKEIKAPEGILILTDIYGSTPSNIAEALQDNHQTRLIAGLNLPMLIKIMNYPHLDLNQLAEKAVLGGRDGIIACQAKVSTT